MIKINVSNTKKVMASFGKYEEEAINMVGKITKITGQEIELKAKSLAPKRDGDLHQNIRNEQQKTKLHYRVTSYMPYSAYMEFGTGGKVKINGDWGTMAMRFKSKGIREVNIRPRPFMYPAFVIGRKNYNRELREEFKILAKKFNQ
jgi:HK97 gp10 family phage protein